MDYGCRTMRTFNTVTAGLTVAQLAGSNPYRMSLLLSPLAAAVGSAAPIVAVVFTPGLLQNWTVPAGVTQIIDAYAWGSGGNSGAAGATLGGGGGGGGAFATTGPLTVVPGDVFVVNVGAGASVTITTIVSPSGTTLASAGPGVTAVLDAAGAAGTAPTGQIKQPGGAGFAATGLAPKGGGGGGAGGNNAAGGAGSNTIGGTGGGVVTILTYGVGGNGGAGSLANIAGVPGVLPGGGGGGGGSVTGAFGAGAAGSAVIFYAPSTLGQALSIDQDPGLVLGRGSMNFLPGITAPYMVSRDMIGWAIIDPWYVISGLANVPVRVTEYSYVPEELPGAIRSARQAPAFTVDPR